MKTDRQIRKIVLAYSGGLDTSVMLRWLKEHYQCEVVCYCADVGQGAELSGLEEKAFATGASKLYVEDLREEFVRDYVWTAVKANAVYEGVYLMGTSLARPVIAKRQIEIAQKEGADAVAHGATGKGNDQVRFELTYYALQPDIKVIAPWREWDFKGRTDLIAYARQHNIPVTATAEKPYSTDANLMHISYEGGILEDPWAESPENIFQLTRSPENARAEAQYVEIAFDKGEPVAIDGKQLDPVALLETLNKLGGEHGIGRVDLVENRFVGMKSRGCYETPGGTLIMAAHREIEGLTLDRSLSHYKQALALDYADLVYAGLWFTPLRESLDAFFTKATEDNTGEVTLRLYKGGFQPVSRKSPNSLYSLDIASFTMGAEYDQKDARGFINLIGLPMQVRALLKNRNKSKAKKAKRK